MKIKHLCTNFQEEYLGLDDTSPVFSWELESDVQNTLQKTYHIVVSAEEQILWDSKTVDSDISVGIAYEGVPLKSRTRYAVRVSVTDNHGNEAMAESWFETGLYTEDWSARWIEPELPPCKEEEPITITQATLGTYKKIPPEKRLLPCSYLRREFQVKAGGFRARLYAAVHGIYTCRINGEKIGDCVWSQEFTPYHSKTYYQVFDVTDYLCSGDNAIGFTIADGWWCGRYGMNGGSCEYGNRHGLLMQLEICFPDGTVQTVSSDLAFTADYGPERYADIFIGEKYDANHEIPGWDRAGYADEHWNGVHYADYDNRLLYAQKGRGVHIARRFPAKCILTTPKREMVVDLGENIAGFVKMSLDAPKGTVITLEHAEVLSRKGNFLKNIIGRNKDQTDIYICKGQDDVFEPSFTFHGFRYVRVTGLPSCAKVSFEGVEITSVTDGAGSFETSDSLINQLQKNIERSQTANMISIPTDCPQRERAGWTGDIQVFLNTAVFNRNVNVFLSRWLEDAALEQLPDGQIPHVIPYTHDYKNLMNSQFQSDSSSGWGDAGVILPMGLYRLYGNKKVLEKQYASMKKWCDYEIGRARDGQPPTKKHAKKGPAQNSDIWEPYIWDTDFHWGDHLIPSISKKLGMLATFGVQPTRPVAATAYLFYSAKLLSEAAGILGYTEDAVLYRSVSEKVKEAFLHRFFTPDGHMIPDWQSAYVLALGLGLVPGKWKKTCVDRLRELIRKNHGCLDCGFLSIQYILRVLSDNGCVKEAYDLLFQDKCPSWMYEVKMGGTTIWEAWTAVSPKGKTGKFSYNHYAFGCVGDWMYRCILGIRNGGTGYKHIIIEPLMDTRLSMAKGCYHSIYGPIRVGWKRTARQFDITAEIPANTTAEIMLPDGTSQTVGSGKWNYTCTLIPNTKGDHYEAANIER